MPITIEQGYYITSVPINHSDTSLKLFEAVLFKELKTNYPDIPFTKVNILPSFNNPKFAGSQLGSANAFVLSLDAEKADCYETKSIFTFCLLSSLHNHII